MPMNATGDVLAAISAMRAERNVEKRLVMLQDLNNSLPASMRLEMPSLITNAYVRRALDIIEDRITLLVSNNTSRSLA